MNEDKYLILYIYLSSSLKYNRRYKSIFFYLSCVATNCVEKISQENDLVIVRTAGVTTWKDRNNNMQSKNGTVFLHFAVECLENYFPSFSFSKVLVDNETKHQLPGSAVDYLKSFGIKILD